ncbi:MAG: hypothetical protein M1812_006435 [Candelaria pacifica]|nr:MAG: hypothetical protein M1812_006435 [Candelaria pacifica]
MERPMEYDASNPNPDIAHEPNTEANRTISPSPAASIDKVSPNDFHPGWRFILAFISLSVISLMAALDATSLSVALSIIAAKLRGTAIEAFWAGTSFLLTSTVFQPSFASFSHIFGRKPLVLVALAFFTVGAIVAAVANNFTTLLVGRSLQGIGGGGILVLTEIIVTDLVPLRLRGQWFGFISMMWAIGSVSGPIVGGAFAQNVSWRWIFWINLPFAGVGLFMILAFLSLNFKPTSLIQQLKRVDWVGSVLFISSATGLLIPVTWGGVMYPWSHWRTLVPLLISAAGLVGFVFYEAYVATEPLIRLSVFNNRTAAVTYFGTFIHGIVLWSILYYEPLYYEAVKDLSPIVTGVALFPETFTVAPASIVVGLLVTKTGRYRWAIWTGWALTIAGAGLLHLLDVNTTTPQWIFLNLVVGLGTGMLFASMAFAIQASASPVDIAFAVAMFSFFRAFGQSVGVAIGGVVFQNALEKKLTSNTLLASTAHQYSSDASGLVQIIESMEHGATRDALIQSYADALKTVWIVMTALAAVAGLASLLTRGLNLDKALETEQGFKSEIKTQDEEKTDEQLS